MPLLLEGIKLIALGTTFKTLWKNPAPNSASCLRPLYLIRAPETDEDLLTLVVPATDKARDSLNENGFVFLISGSAFDVEVIIYDSMKDLKFKRMISGLGGADCLLCVSQQKDWMDPEKYPNGFEINCNDLYNGTVKRFGD